MAVDRVVMCSVMAIFPAIGSFPVVGGIDRPWWRPLMNRICRWFTVWVKTAHDFNGGMSFHDTKKQLTGTKASGMVP
jgi:hypothetical protein